MLLKQATVSEIANGNVTTLFRRWQRPRVRAGSSFRTSLGVVSVESVEPTRLDAITARAARDAGYPSRAALLEELARHPGGRLYRITVRLAGADPRLALRARDRFGADDREQLLAMLARLGARTAQGPWALPVLRLIEAHPATRAAELAERVDMETRPFKARVRQLKELGLTESLGVGYRLSPRGRALLRPPRR
jgi:hypothetical protein